MSVQPVLCNDEALFDQCKRNTVHTSTGALTDAVEALLAKFRTSPPTPTLVP